MYSTAVLHSSIISYYLARCRWAKPTCQVHWLFTPVRAATNTPVHFLYALSFTFIFLAM